MSQQSNDDLARAIDGLGETKPKPPPATPPRPAPQIPQIKIRQLPAKPAARPAQPTARPAQPAAVARPVQPVGKPAQTPRPVTRAAPTPSVNHAGRGTRAASPLDAPAALASAIEAKPSVTKVRKTPTHGGATLARTLIPILLTLGFILVTLSAVRFLWDSIDNPMLAISPTAAWIVGGFGVLVWGLAALVMATVVRKLRPVAPIAPPAATPADQPAAKRPLRAARPD